MAFAAAAVERAMTYQQVIMRALAGSLTWPQAADILNIHPRGRYAGGELAMSGIPSSGCSIAAASARRTSRPPARRCRLRRVLDALIRSRAARA